MKIIKKLFLVALSAGLLSVPSQLEKVEAANEQTLYFKAPDWWLSDGAGVGVHHWKDGGNGTSWPGKRATLVEGTTNIFTYTLDVEAYPSFIFTRIPGSGTISDWGAKTPNLSWSGANGHNMYDASSSTVVWGDPGVSGTWVDYDPSVPTPAYQVLSGIVNPYYNNGFYVRESLINIDMTNEDVKNDLIGAFHASSIETERKTYFEGDELWMTNSAGTINSGYGTNGDKMTHFSYVNGNKVQDWEIAQTGGMEGKYTTLKDISESISEEQDWVEETAGVFKSENKDLLQKFLDFTAPCFLNTADKNVSNVFTLDYVTIQETSNKLILSLYVESDTSGFIKNGGTLLSTATISKSTDVDVRGEFNNWNAGSFVLRNAGQNANIHQNVIYLKAGTYKFKVTENGSYLGNNGTITDSVSNWTFTGSENDCTLKITTAGNYKFTFNTSTDKLTVAKV